MNQPVESPHPPPRDRRRRAADTLRRLDTDVDAWVASADSSGVPHLVPLSFLWDGSAPLFATPAASQTSRNLPTGARVRVGLGPTRDVVLIEGTVLDLPDTEPSPEIGDAFAVKTGFDPRTLSTSYRYFRVQPLRVQAWREADELGGRELMRHGEWVEPA